MNFSKSHREGPGRVMPTLRGRGTHACRVIMDITCISCATCLILKEMAFWIKKGEGEGRGEGGGRIIACARASNWPQLGRDFQLSDRTCQPSMSTQLSHVCLQEYLVLK